MFSLLRVLPFACFTRLRRSSSSWPARTSTIRIKIDSRFSRCRLEISALGGEAGYPLRRLLAYTLRASPGECLRHHVGESLATRDAASADTPPLPHRVFRNRGATAGCASSALYGRSADRRNLNNARCREGVRVGVLRSDFQRATRRPSDLPAERAVSRLGLRPSERGCPLAGACLAVPPPWRPARDPSAYSSITSRTSGSIDAAAVRRVSHETAKKTRNDSTSATADAVTPAGKVNALR